MISLSICIPTFNRSKYLNRLLESLAKQKDIENIETDLEIVIVDDGSNDQTSNIIEKWKMCNKFIINSFFQINKGRSYALHKAITNAKKNYCLIMDDEDYFINDFLINLQAVDINEINQNNKIAGVCFLRKNNSSNFKNLQKIKEPFLLDLITIRNKYSIINEFAEICTKKTIQTSVVPHAHAQ